MRSLMRMLRAVARAMKSLVMVTVRVAGRLVTMLLPQPLPAIDELEPDVKDGRERDTGSAFMALRNLAYARLQGRMPTPSELAAAGKLSCEWVSVMPKHMLKAVLLADDAKLHRHMRGVETLRGVLRYEESAIDEYRIAQLRERAREETARRTMTPVRYA